MRTTVRARVLVALLAALGAAACREQPAPLTVDRGRIVLSNLTSEPWTDVEVWLNRYYRAQVPRLDAGGRLDAPLTRFQGGFGHYFDPKRETVREVKATATTPSGRKIEFTWPPAGPRGAGPATGT